MSTFASTNPFSIRPGGEETTTGPMQAKKDLLVHCTRTKTKKKVEKHCLISLYILVTIMKMIIKSEQVSLKEN